MKTCTQCGVEKDESEFTKCKSRPRSNCAICTRKNNTRYRMSHPEISLLTDARRRAKARDLPFNLELSDIVIPAHCPVLGIPLARTVTGQGVDGSPSLDRIISELGYVKGNVIIVSWRMNQIKNNATVHELIRIAEFYSKLVLQSPNGGS